MTPESETARTVRKLSFREANRILVVDDNAINQMLTRQLLEQRGIPSDAALSGEEALEKIRTGKYAAIFMDYVMPDMNGIEVTRRIRSLEGAISEIPIIAYTSSSAEDGAKPFFEAGMDDFMVKPIQSEQLNRILARWLPCRETRVRESRAQNAPAPSTSKPVYERDTGRAGNFGADADPDTAAPGAADVANLLVFFARDQRLEFTRIKFGMLELGESLGRMNDRFSQTVNALLGMSDVVDDTQIALWIVDARRSREETVRSSGRHISRLLRAIGNCRRPPDGYGGDMAREEIEKMHCAVEKTTLKLNAINACIDNVNGTLRLLGDSANAGAGEENMSVIARHVQAVSRAFQKFHEERGSLN